ncbi:hypothetical protein ACRN9J_03495 [Shewanella baltica]|uniref:hypothetical protein n=1 Tax=Shewanella TaxID=22 RepID=UPI0021D971F3|nr:hypothetical protein [Shewanella sp. SM69]MCU8037996.1 hypothetical protein [Shewanella sp. SM69]
MKRKFLALSIISFSSLAFGKPVYLNCSVSSNNETKVFSTKLDEESGKITHLNKGGGAFNAEGFFSANKISYQKVSAGGGIKMTYLYEINRTTLAITETFVAEPSDPKMALTIPASTILMSGACEIEEVGERKI